MAEYFPESLVSQRYVCVTGPRRFCDVILSIFGEKRLLCGHKVNHKFMALAIQCCVSLVKNGDIKRFGTIRK